MAEFITSKTFEKEILKSEKPVVIDMFASWCGPCQYMSPVIDELAEEMANKYKIVKINIDEERELAVKFNVSSIPTFVFIKNGKMVGKEIGYMDKETFKKKIEKNLG